MRGGAGWKSGRRVGGSMELHHRKSRAPRGRDQRLGARRSSWPPGRAPPAAHGGGGAAERWEHGGGVLCSGQRQGGRLRLRWGCAGRVADPIYRRRNLGVRARGADVARRSRRDSGWPLRGAGRKKGRGERALTCGASMSVERRARAAAIACWAECGEGGPSAGMCTSAGGSADKWAWDARGRSLERGPLEYGARTLR